MLIIPFIIIFLLIINIVIFQNETHYESYYSKRIKNNKINPKIYDIGHKYLPNLEYHEYIINIILVLSFIVFLKYPNIITPFFILLLFIFIFRLFVSQLTVLPKMKKCVIKSTPDINGYCYDKIFSGHTAVLCLITLFLFNLKQISIYSLFFINIIYGLIIIATRAHYTIDVVFSFIVTFTIFQNRKYFFKLLK